MTTSAMFSGIGAVGEATLVPVDLSFTPTVLNAPPAGFPPQIPFRVQPGVLGAQQWPYTSGPLTAGDYSRLGIDTSSPNGRPRVCGLQNNSHDGLNPGGAGFCLPPGHSATVRMEFGAPSSSTFPNIASAFAPYASGGSGTQY